MTTPDAIPATNNKSLASWDDISLEIPDCSFSKIENLQSILQGLPTRRDSFEKQKIELADAIKEIQNLRNNHSSIDRFQSVLSSFSPKAILATDKDLNIIGWNQSAGSFFGLTSEQTASLETQSHIVKALKTRVVFNSLAEQGYWICNLPVINRDGKTISCQVSIGVLWDQSTTFDGLIAIYHGIPVSHVHGPAPVESELDKIVKQRTEDLENSNRVLQMEIAIHKQSALLTRESEGKNRDLLDNIKLGVFRCTPGPKGKFIEVNKAMEEITGYSREELLQIDICMILTNTEKGVSYINDISITDWKVTRELQLTRKDGRKILVENTIVAIRLDSGVIQYFDGILEDITERKHAQIQVQQSLNQLQKTIKEIIEAMAYIGEVRDPYTAGHQRRVAHLSYKIAELTGLSDDNSEGLTMAAFVHDIGKILVPSDILSKPGKLSKPEFDMLKDHTRIGYEILKTIDFPWPIAEIVLQHHERLNGSGYPAGLTGDRIIMEARILAVADVVEAMSSHRPYRPTLGLEKALEEIKINRGTLYDPQVVDACLKLFKDTNFDLQ